MTPEQKLKMRQMYADNLLELMALQPELFDDKATGQTITTKEHNAETGSSEALSVDPLPVEFSHAYFRSKRPAGGWPRQFAIVTAHDPNGLLTWPEANQAADERLRAILAQRGLEHFRVTGGSRDGHHEEPGWGITLATPQIAQELSELFLQLAFFWVEADRFSLIDTRSGQRTDLASWAERWLGTGDV